MEHPFNSVFFGHIFQLGITVTVLGRVVIFLIVLYLFCALSLDRRFGPLHELFVLGVAKYDLGGFIFVRHLAGVMAVYTP